MTLPPERTPPPPPAGNAARPESPQTAPTSTSAPAPTTIPTTTTATTTLATTTATTTPTTGPAYPPLPPPSTLDARGAAKALDSGLDLLKHDKTIEARTALSAAFLSGRLSAAQARQAQSELEKLAQKTIFSDEVLEGDPYAYYYTIQPGDMFVTLECRLHLHVPDQLITRINNLSRPQDIRSGQRIKFIRGPFHAIVSKSRFTVDVLLQREDLPPVWVAGPLRAGQERHDSAGRLAGRQGRRRRRGAPRRETRSPDLEPARQRRYPRPDRFRPGGLRPGHKGLWIGLVGIDASTRGRQHYGIHSTSDPASIGKEQSLGCIRLADDDIDLLYSLLYEVHSTVQIRP